MNANFQPGGKVPLSYIAIPGTLHLSDRSYSRCHPSAWSHREGEFQNFGYTIYARLKTVGQVAELFALLLSNFWGRLRSRGQSVGARAHRCQHTVQRATMWTWYGSIFPGPSRQDLWGSFPEHSIVCTSRGARIRRGTHLDKVPPLFGSFLDQLRASVPPRIPQ